MIAHLQGVLFKKSPQCVIIEAGGIGYEVFVPLSTFYALPDHNEKVSLHIYTHVREDALLLFGFHTRLEKDLFLMLTAVSGIGPRLAANVLSGTGPHQLVEAIAQGDVARLQAIPGVGKKTAERIALELKTGAGQLLGQQEEFTVSARVPEDGRAVDDALSALQNLGYSEKAAKRALDRVSDTLPEVTLENLIREALKELAS